MWKEKKLLIVKTTDESFEGNMVLLGHLLQTFISKV